MCSFVEFLRTVLKLCPTISCATFFGPPDISGISFLWPILYLEASIELFYWSGLKPDYIILFWQKRKTQIESS